MLSLFAVPVVLYFTKILSGSRKTHNLLDINFLRTGIGHHILETLLRIKPATFEVETKVNLKDIGNRIFIVCICIMSTLEYLILFFHCFVHLVSEKIVAKFCRRPSS